MEKKTIRLNENQLRKIISEAVKKALSEEPENRFKDDDEIWAQIEKEGGKSWTDEDSGLHLYIDETERHDGLKIYVVRDDEGGVFGYSQYLHKAQRSLYNAAVRLLVWERIKKEGLGVDI